MPFFVYQSLSLSLVKGRSSNHTVTNSPGEMVYLAPTRQNGLKKASGADAFQVKSVSVNRFVKKLGVATNDQIDEIVDAIALCIGYNP